MTFEIPRPPLKGNWALVGGIANENSVAYGCAKAFRALKTDPAITYLNEHSKQYVERLANALVARIFMPLKTRAASGQKDFDLLLNAAVQRAPLGELVNIMA